MSIRPLTPKDCGHNPEVRHPIEIEFDVGSMLPANLKVLPFEPTPPRDLIRHHLGEMFFEKHGRPLPELGSTIRFRDRGREIAGTVKKIGISFRRGGNDGELVHPWIKVSAGNCTFMVWDEVISEEIKL